MDDDSFELHRFVDAQRDIYASAVAELAAGRKRSHWMWFVFPQLAGLGGSAMATRYAISGLDEARAYLAHASLGARLHECADLVLAHRGVDARRLLGSPDDLKLCSSMTLFERAASAAAPFGDVIDAFYAGRRDARTLELLELD